MAGQELPNSYLRARALMLNHEYDSAIIHLNKVIAEKPSGVEARYNRGICLFEMKRYDDAISEFLLINRQRNGRGSLMLAKIETKLNHEELAVKFLREHLRSSYKVPEKDILLDEVFVKLESHVAWKGLWKEKEWYSTYDKALQEALYLKSTGAYLEAINHLNDLEKKGFKKTLVYQYLAEIYLVSGNKKAALEALEKSINSNSRNLETLKLRIDLLTSNEEFKKAQQDCNRLLKQAPDEFDYYLIAGRIESRLGEYESAVKKVKFYLELYPLSPEANNELGEIHFDKGKYINALSSFNRTLELDKSNAGYYYNRGRTYAATKTYKYAERDFSMALDLNPMDPDTWFSKGIIDAELGNTDTACFDFKKAFQYGKYEAKKYIDRLCSK
jgi:tetratricopeptide (TPR) repeat protein